MRGIHGFRGTFMRNEKLPKSGCYVLNLDEMDDHGTHWVAVFNDEYYDSYGLPPPEKLSALSYNMVQHQKINSPLCGLYSCFYLYCRNLGISRYIVCYDLLKAKGNKKILLKWLNLYIA